MIPEQKEVIKEWYYKAAEDLLAAKPVIKTSPMLYDVAAFHSPDRVKSFI